MVRIAHDAAAPRTILFSNDWLMLGELEPPLRSNPRGVLRARVAADGASIVGDYAGPRDLEQG
jgi:hypothetical protein